MPADSIPRITPLAMVKFFAGMKAPGAANTVFKPARALGAPQTTCNGAPSPTST